MCLRWRSRYLGPSCSRSCLQVVWALKSSVCFRAKTQPLPIRISVCAYTRAACGAPAFSGSVQEGFASFLVFSSQEAVEGRY